MKLLLDEMWTPEIAVQLRRKGYDVAAVAERPELCGQPDSLLFTVALSEGRAMVTENIDDYHNLAAEALQRSDEHAGLIFTTDRRHPRGDPRTIGRVVNALLDLLSSERDLSNQEYWLP